MTDCVFCKIVAGQIPATKEYEDDNFLGFRDIKPQSEMHVIFVPKVHLPSLGVSSDLDAHILGKMLLAMRDTAKKLAIDKAYKIFINNGSFQEVPHIHFHLIGEGKKGGI